MLNTSLPTMRLVDEVELLDLAQTMLLDANYSVESIRHQLNMNSDSDLNTALCYLYLKHKQRNFIDQIDRSVESDSINKEQWHFIIVPALLHKMYPALGGNGHLFSDIASKFGHTVEILNTDGGRTQSETADLIAQAIDQYSDSSHKLCLVGISRGTADIFTYLHHFGQDEVSLVINIAGLIKGTPLASHLLSTPRLRLKYRLIAAYCHIDFQAIKDLACENLIFSRTEQIASTVNIINFIGAPLKSHVQPHLLKRYISLSKYGPNDGMVMLDDYLDFPGLTYPLWGGDHFFRLPGYSQLLYRLFNSLSEFSFGK